MTNSFSRFISKKDAELLKSVNLIELAVGLYALSMLNFPLALVTAIFSVPVAVFITSAEDQPVLALIFCVSANPSIWVVGVRLWISFRVVQREPSRRNNHRTLRCSVILLCDIEVLLDDVRHHDDGRAVSESLFHAGACIDLMKWLAHMRRGNCGVPWAHHLIQIIELDFSSWVWSNSCSLFPNLRQYFRTIYGQLQKPTAGRACRILAGKQEGEDSHADFVVCEHS